MQKRNKEQLWLLKEKYHGVESPEYFSDCSRLQAGEPLAYVIGWVDFLGCRIDLSYKPLIPRPETEWWVEKAISEISSTHGDKVIPILDLFAGSGCIGIALLKHLPLSTVDFGEFDEGLSEQIRRNIILNNIDEKRTSIVATNVFSGISGSYDYIFTNPPYIDPAALDTVEDSVLRHEPHRALFAEQNGLHYLERLLKESGEYLKPGGTLFIEFGSAQKDAVENLAREYHWKATISKDQLGKWRYGKFIRQKTA